MMLAGNEFNLTQNNASANVIIDTVNPLSVKSKIYSKVASRFACKMVMFINITSSANGSECNYCRNHARYVLHYVRSRNSICKVTVRLFPARSKAVMDLSSLTLQRGLHLSSYLRMLSGL